jgi:hypothetical protein
MKGTVIASQSVAVHWRDVLAVSKFCSSDIERFDLWGVRVELSKSEDAEWPAVLVATDGRRLAALESTVKVPSAWPEGMPMAFTIPRPILSRVKKPGRENKEAWAQVAFDWVEYPPGETAPAGDAEPTPERALENMSVWGGWDEVQVSMQVVPHSYPKWRQVLPAGPYTLARDVKVDGIRLGDFSSAVASICGDQNVALYRGKILEDSDEGGQPLIVRGKPETFVGMIMPPRMEIGSTFLLPLWARAS